MKWCISMKKNSQLAIIFFVVFLFLAGFGLVIPILPSLAKSFGGTPFQIGAIMAVYSGMQFLFSPFWGKLSDKYGRRPIILTCLLGEAFAYILFAFSRQIETLFLSRLIAGFFAGSISTASAYISDVTPPQERSKGMALIGVAFGLGFIIGPALGAGLTMWGEQLSSEAHFATSFASLWVAGLCFMSFLFGLRFLKESLHHSLRQSHPVRPSRLAQIFHYLTKPVVGNLIVVFFLASLAMSTMEATLILFMGDKFQWGLREVSLGFAYLGVIIIFTQGFLVRKLIPRWGERKVLLTGLCLIGSGLAGVIIAPDIAWMGVTMTLLSIGNGLTNPSTLGSISLLSPADQQGAVLGTTQGLSSLGRIIGPLFGGYVYQAFFIGAPYMAGSLMAFIGLVIVVLVYQKLPESGKKVA